MAESRLPSAREAADSLNRQHDARNDVRRCVQGCNTSHLLPLLLPRLTPLRRSRRRLLCLLE